MPQLGVHVCEQADQKGRAMALWGQLQRSVTRAELERFIQDRFCLV